MSLAPGVRLGRYEIRSQIGSGGMGEVYLAWDSELDRTIALKILPTEIASDPERMRRFVQEAKSASALNHPNILIVHDVGRSDSIPFMVTEHVEGDTLRARLRKGRLPLAEALDVAIQIASALSEAHHAGIIHRDIKPENVMVRSGGLVKVVDFGLAKATVQDLASLDPDAPTEALFQTAAGTVFGTAAYMSPEQAHGLNVDARTDLFSLGVTLYEMVAGRAPFVGVTTTDVMASVLRTQPTPLVQVVSDSPTEFDRIVAKALAKDPEERYQSAKDLTVDLKHLRRSLEKPITTERSKKLLVGASVLGVVVAAVGFGMYESLFRKSGNAAVETSAAMAAPLTAYPGFEQGPSLSPDGSQVAFSWNGPRQDNYDIYIKLVGPGEPVQLTQNPAPDTTPAWSPNGDRIAFLRRTSESTAELIVMPALRGAEERIATISPGYSRNRPFNNLSWTPDGKWLAFGGALSPDGARGIWLIAAAGGETRRLTETVGGGIGDVSPVPSPDGRQMAFIRERITNRSAVFVLPLTSDRRPNGTPTEVTSASWGLQGLAWMPDGRGLLFSWGGHGAPSRLRRISILPGESGIAAPELLPFGDQATALSISRSGRIVYSTQLRDVELFEIPLSGTSQPKIVSGLSSTLDEHTPHYSPDGERLAFASTRSGTEEIWIANSDGTNPLKMTSMGGPQCSNPQWSPDGERIVFNSRREGTADLYILQPDTGEVRRLTHEPSEEIEPRWSRDGQRIYFGSNKTGRHEVWQMPSAGGVATQITRQGGLTATESPDGGFLYYAKDARSPTTIWRVPVGGGMETEIVDRLSYSNNFVVADRGLYFVAVADTPDQTSIDFVDFSTSRRTSLVRLGKPWYYGMALSPRKDSLLVSLVDSAGANLMVVDNFR
jgi:Tol biopolymer transport system component